jgi:hypothetical protein
VKSKLISLKAYMKDGKIFDGSGQELYFYHVPDFDGTPGARVKKDGVEARRSPVEEIRELEARGFRVVKMFIGRGPAD